MGAANDARACVHACIDAAELADEQSRALCERIGVRIGSDDERRLTGFVVTAAIRAVRVKYGFCANVAQWYDMDDQSIVYDGTKITKGDELPNSRGGTIVTRFRHFDDGTLVVMCRDTWYGDECPHHADYIVKKYANR